MFDDGVADPLRHGGAAGNGDAVRLAAVGDDIDEIVVRKHVGEFEQRLRYLDLVIGELDHHVARRAVERSEELGGGWTWPQASHADAPITSGFGVLSGADEGPPRWWTGRRHEHDGVMNDSPDDRIASQNVRTLGEVRRSSDDRIVAGVCAGVARHLNIDPLLVRIGVVALTFIGLAGLILYLAAWFLLPEDLADKSVAAEWFNLDQNEPQRPAEPAVKNA